MNILARLLGCIACDWIHARERCHGYDRKLLLSLASLRLERPCVFTVPDVHVLITFVTHADGSKTPSPTTAKRDVTHEFVPKNDSYRITRKFLFGRAI